MTLAAAGADVAITYRDSAAEAHATVEELRKLKVRAMAVQCDVRDGLGVRFTNGVGYDRSQQKGRGDRRKFFMTNWSDCLWIGGACLL